MSSSVNTGAAVPMMGSSRPSEGECRDAQDAAKLLQTACNDVQAAASESAPGRREPERTGASREQVAPESQTPPSPVDRTREHLEGDRRRFPSVVELVGVYVDRLADLRSRAGDSQRDTYTVAIGQLRAIGLIDDATWREAIERPRQKRSGSACPSVSRFAGRGYVFATWRDAIADAQSGVAHAYDRRRRTFQAAFNAGLTLAQISEAAGLSAAGVHKIIGKQRSATLDEAPR